MQRPFTPRGAHSSLSLGVLLRLLKPLKPQTQMFHTRSSTFARLLSCRTGGEQVGDFRMNQPTCKPQMVLP